MEIQFDISHQHLVVHSGYYVVSNSENYITAKFTFSDDWENMSKTAVFRRSGADESSAVSVELTGSTCDVPEEALKYPGMRVYIIGSDGTTVIHTNAELIKIVKSGGEDTDDITGGINSGSDAQGGAVIVVDDIVSPESENPVSSKALWKEFAKKVSKVDGMGLSENSYTTEEKTKLSGIAKGAEVNVQSDWSQTNADADDYIKNKPTSLPASDVYDWAKQPEKPKYTAAEVGAMPSDTEIPSYSVATQSADGLMSAADKVKLDGLSEGGSGSCAGKLVTVNMTSYNNVDHSEMYITCDTEIVQNTAVFYALVDNCGVISELSESAGSLYDCCWLNDDVDLCGGNEAFGAGLETKLNNFTTTYALHWNGTEWEQVKRSEISEDYGTRISSAEERITALENTVGTANDTLAALLSEGV